MPRYKANKKGDFEKSPFLFLNGFDEVPLELQLEVMLAADMGTKKTETLYVHSTIRELVH